MELVEDNSRFSKYSLYSGDGKGHYEKEAEGVAINAIIWVERDSQKGIVVGKGGKHLKKVGREARLELKKKLGVPVHLELWVKVKDNWADSDKELQRLGYELK